MRKIARSEEVNMLVAILCVLAVACAVASFIIEEMQPAVILSIVGIILAVAAMYCALFTSVMF